MITSQENQHEQSVAIIVNADSFVGSFLSESLLARKCAVYYFGEITQNEKNIFLSSINNKNFFSKNKNIPSINILERIDYVFFFVKNLETDKENVDILFGVTKSKQARVVLVFSQYDERVTGIVPSGVDCRVVVLGPVYGPRMTAEKYGRIESEAKEKEPLYIGDAIYGLTKTMFASGTKGKRYFLFKQDAGLAEEIIYTQNSLGWKPLVDFQKGSAITREYLKSQQEKKDYRFFKEEPKKIVPLPPKLKPKPKPKKAKKKIVYLWTIPAVLFIYFILLPLFHVALALGYLKAGMNLVQKGNFRQSTEKSEKASEYFVKATEDVRRIKFFINFFKNEKGDELYRLMEAGSEGSKVLASLGSAAEKTDLLKQIIFQGRTTNLPEVVLALRSDLAGAYEHLSLVEAAGGDKSLIAKFSKGFTLTEIKKQLALSKELIEILPVLIGEDGKTTFLVLLQNNSELRPTGGFIGSYALLSFDHGKLIDFQVFDVYDADGQLVGHVEPPADLKEFLGEAGWYLRDSNWNPDFPTSARRAIWFLEKETKRKVDGVVAINLNVAQKLLEAFGEINVADFGESINKDNLFERAEYYSEVNFFPGSTQKKDFLGSLSRALFNRLKEADTKTWASIGQKMFQAAEAKDLMVYFDDPKVMKSLSRLNLSGEIKEINCYGQDGNKDQNCFTDYLMVVEANVGVNKANYFVNRDVVHRVWYDENNFLHESLQIAYTNTSPSSVFPAGDYKNYLRLIVPEDSRIEAVKVGGAKVSTVIRREKIGDKQSFGFLVDIPVGESRLVEVAYRRTKKIETGKQGRLLFYFQKQSGVVAKNFTFYYSPPEGSAGDKLINSPVFEKDLLFDVTFKRG